MSHDLHWTHGHGSGRAGMDLRVGVFYASLLKF